MPGRRMLVAYYSRKGNNYVGGNIMDLPVGNTEVVAKKIQALTGCDTFRIETVKAYPEDYIAVTVVAKEEKKANARPELKAKGTGIENYDVICLGYPNWWGTMPMAVLSFLESHDLSGKIIMPYCTHEGGGLGGSERDIKKSCPNSKVEPGLAMVGGSVAGADREVEAWLKKNGLKDR